MKHNYEFWSIKSLKKEQERIFSALKKKQEKLDLFNAKKLKINNITTKDIAVRYGVTDDDLTQFSFFVKHKGKLHCIYYDNGYHEVSEDKPRFKYYDWWPIKLEKDEDGEVEENGAYEFIPNGFAECCENSYEYCNGNFKSAIKKLKDSGITDIEKGDW